MKTDWPFDEEPTMAAITTQSVIDGTDSIRFVSHDLNDGGWQFLPDKPATVQDGRVVGLKEIIDLDSTLKELSDLPPGWIARRSSRESKWVRTENK